MSKERKCGTNSKSIQLLTHRPVYQTQIFRMEKQLAEKGTVDANTAGRSRGLWWALGANETGNKSCSHRIPLLVLPAAKKRLMTELQLSGTMD